MVDDGLPYNGWRQFPHSVAGGGILDRGRPRALRSLTGSDRIGTGF
jgi:hypothetical protein